MENELQICFMHAVCLEKIDMNIKQLLCALGQLLNHYKGTYPREAQCGNIQTHRIIIHFQSQRTFPPGKDERVCNLLFKKKQTYIFSCIFRNLQNKGRNQCNLFYDGMLSTMKKIKYLNYSSSILCPIICVPSFPQPWSTASRETWSPKPLFYQSLLLYHNVIPSSPSSSTTNTHNFHIPKGP